MASVENEFFLDNTLEFNKFLADFEYFLSKTENFRKNLSFCPDIIVAILNFFHVILPHKLEKIV